MENNKTDVPRRDSWGRRICLVFSFTRHVYKGTTMQTTKISYFVPLCLPQGVHIHYWLHSYQTHEIYCTITTRCPGCHICKFIILGPYMISIFFKLIITFTYDLILYFSFSIFWVALNLDCWKQRAQVPLCIILTSGPFIHLKIIWWTLHVLN